MASILDYGAGASEGLDNLLTRMLLEQRQAEVERSNRADEGLRGRGLMEQAAQRALAQKSLDASREDTASSRVRDDIRANANTRPTGREVSPAEYEKETTVGGIADDFFLKERKYSDDFVGPTQDDRDTKVIKWAGTKDPTSSGSPESMQQVTMNLDDGTGKKTPTDVEFHPRTGTYTVRGEDVTNRVSHYEKPPAPDRVLIQTGDGYMRRPDAAAQLTQGNEVPLATTSSTRTMSEGAKMLEPHIKAIGEQARALDKAGLFGPAMSRIRNVLAKVGTIDEFYDTVSSDPELSRDKMVGKFATTLGLLASGAGRVHGGARGGGSTQMLTYFKNMLSDASTLDLFLGRIEGVDDYMTGYAAGPGGKTAAAPAETPRRRVYDPATGTLK